jgi:hypothetical protein
MSKHSFLSVNMRCRNVAMHSLLETNTLDDVLFVQELWFDRIRVERSDREREGVDVLGGAKHPDWDLFYPHFNTNKQAKVMTYRRKQVNNRLNPIQIIPRLDLAKHHTILITDIRVHKDTIHVINFYNDMDDQSSIKTLLQLDLDPMVPTMLVGDFNLHSRTWSPQNWEQSTKAPAFEQWAATQTFALHTQPGDITRRGLESERPSTLDLTWHNWALEVNISITPPTLDWEASLGSDHCGIRSLWFCDSPAKGDKRPFLSAFKAGTDTATEKEWKETLANALPTITPIITPTELHTAARELQHAFDTACEKHFQHKHVPKAHGHRWWNTGCTAAAEALKSASGSGDKEAIKQANAMLRKVTKMAKREWADNIIAEGQVWEVARWQHGRKQSQITAMRTSASQLTFDDNEIAESLAN